MQTEQNKGTLVSRIFGFFKPEDIEVDESKNKTVSDYQGEIDGMLEDSPDTSILEAIRNTLQEEQHLKEIREELRRNSTSSRRESSQNQ